ncbi:hypothetical protein D3C74_483810 [compost metagenome]
MITRIVDKRSPFGDIRSQVFRFLLLQELGPGQLVDVHGNTDFGQLRLNQDSIIFPVVKAGA